MEGFTICRVHLRSATTIYYTPRVQFEGREHLASEYCHRKPVVMASLSYRIQAPSKRKGESGFESLLPRK